VVLIGMMGSGKSTVGELLSRRTGWPHHDNDQLLQTLFDATPREILAAGDAASLLAAEVDALRAGLAAATPSIVSVAGGTIADAAAREALADSGLVVWLRVDAATIHERAGVGDHRPWPNPDRLDWIRDALVQREALYASVAQLTLDADQVPAGELADQILDNLEKSGLCREVSGRLSPALRDLDHEGGDPLAGQPRSRNCPSTLRPETTITPSATPEAPDVLDLRAGVKRHRHTVARSAWAR
jgi:shikimate kinase